MQNIMLGADAALRLDEKFHIISLSPANKEVQYRLNSTCFAIADEKGEVLRLGNAFEHCSFTETFLGGQYKFEDSRIAAKVRVSVFTPFYPGEDAHIPAALFVFKIKNSSKKKRVFRIGALAENVSDCALNEKIEIESAFGGIRFSPANLLSVQEGYMTHCLLMDGDVQTVSYVKRNTPEESFCNILKRGVLEGESNVVPNKQLCSALVREIKLGAGESETLFAVYAWHAPYLKFSTYFGEGAYRNGYLHRFKDSAEIATYVMNHKNRFFEIHKTVTKSVRGLQISDIIKRSMVKNLNEAVLSLPYKLAEKESAKAFYHNSFGAPYIYAFKHDAACDFSLSALDSNSMVEMLFWQMKYLTDADGTLQKLPSVGEGSRFKEQADDLYGYIRPFLQAYSVLLRKGEMCFVEPILDELKRIWDAIERKFVIEIDGTRVIGNGNVCDIFNTNLFVLAATCFRVVLEALGDHAFSEHCAEIAIRARDFVEQNGFNGRFFIDTYKVTTEESTGVCNAKQVIPMTLAYMLGVTIVNPIQFKLALENIYVLNFSDATGCCGLRAASDGELIDNTVEWYYICSLLFAEKTYLAALILKARDLRNDKNSICEDFSLMHSSVFGTVYNAFEKMLDISNGEFVLFSGASVLVGTEKNGLVVRTYGAPIEINAVRCNAGLNARIFKDDTEFLGEKIGNIIHLNAPVVLSENEVLKIHYVRN